MDFFKSPALFTNDLQSILSVTSDNLRASHDRIEIPATRGYKRVPRPLLIDPTQRYTLAETHAVLGHSHVKTFQDIKRGTLLETVKDGRRRYVLGSELIRRSRLSD